MELFIVTMLLCAIAFWFALFDRNFYLYTGTLLIMSAAILVEVIVRII